MAAETLDPYTIKQIGGRAGRYMQDGLVSAFSQADLQQIRQSINSKGYVKKQQQSDDEEDDEEEPSEEFKELVEDRPKKKLKINFTGEQQLIKQACLFPSFSLIQQFAEDLQLHEKVHSPLSRVIKK